MQSNETHITLAEAAKLSPGRPSTNCVWRWARRGIRSRSGPTVRLEHMRVGGRIFTSPEALTRFFGAVADSDAAHFDRRTAGAEPTLEVRPDGQKQQAIVDAEAELQAEGFE